MYAHTYMYVRIRAHAFMYTDTEAYTYFRIRCQLPVFHYNVKKKSGQSVGLIQQIER